MGEWKSVSLGDCVELLSGFPFKSAKFSSDPSDVRLVRGDNIVQGAMRWNGAARWPAGEIAEYSKFELREGDVVLAMDRPWIEAGLKWCCLRADDVPSLLVQRVARLRSTDGVCQGFIRAVIGSPEFTAYIKTIITGANVPHISGPDIRKYRFCIPPLETQRRIAAVLSAYDDLIENNAKRIRVLEEMARAVYREWFVHFRHPGHAGTSLPTDWKRTTLGALVTIEKDSLDPRDTPDTEFDLHSFEACDLGRLPIPTMGQAIQSNKFRVPEDVVLLPKLNPHIPRVWMPLLEGDRPAICSTEFLVLKPRAGIPRSYVYAMVEGANFSAGLAQRADGTSNSHKRLKPDDVMSRPVVEPSRELLARFDEVASTLLRSVHTLRKKNRGLRAARDLLLPKLLSGELSVDRIPDPAAAG